MVALSAMLRNLTRRAACFAKLGWIVAFVASVQGWTPVGAEWHAGAGRSVWSRCGLALCSCGSAAAPLPAHPERCCPEDEATGGSVGVGALPLLAALGQERRDGSPEVSAPEVIVLAWPASAAVRIDLPRESGRVDRVRESRWVAPSAEVPVPPPRA
ncbi:MAG TPA: hypothetical protein PLU35_09475 [Phycisphaerales bacterium]|nr:hypothetical protein [Phycisphaerales bacterium]